MMTPPDNQRQYQGGCHCGAVRFAILTDAQQGINCNCSICQKKGFLHLIIPSDRFRLLQGETVLSTYRFNTGVAQHHFCSICGIHAFYRPRSHPESYDINLRCLDADALQDFEILPFDGQHWEDNIHNLHSQSPS